MRRWAGEHVAAAKLQRLAIGLREIVGNGLKAGASDAAGFADIDVADIDGIRKAGKQAAQDRQISN